jgi:hypothetical protein
MAKDLQKVDPSNTLAYYVKARNGKKRNYIYDYAKSRLCDHPRLSILARGGIIYRCEECNYTFHITGAYQQPWHNEVIQAGFTWLGFAKQHGMNALVEVLRRPSGQSDGSPHKPVLPEGKSFIDCLQILEDVDVNVPDGGALQLAELVDRVWVSEESRARRQAEIDGMDPSRRPKLPVAKEALKAGNTDEEPKAVSRRSKGRKANN